jgi:molybdenum cofactor cytidylyltransferase
MVSAVLLAAGSSTRMGGVNKLLLPWKSSTVIGHTVQQLLSSGAGEVIVVTGYQPEQVKKAISEFRVAIVHNPMHAAGMTGSIQAGVAAAAGDAYMICLGDLPSIDATEYYKLVNGADALAKQPEPFIVLPRYKNEKANPVIFSSYFRQAILNHKEPEGCREIVAANQQYIHWVDMECDHVLRDIDSTTDYQNLLYGNRSN